VHYRKHLGLINERNELFNGLLTNVGIIQLLYSDNILSINAYNRQMRYV